MRDRSPFLRKASQTVARFASRRSLPKWRKDTYRDRSDWRYPTAEENTAAREIVLDRIAHGELPPDSANAVFDIAA